MTPAIAQTIRRGIILMSLIATTLAATARPSHAQASHLLVSETAAQNRPDSFFSSEGRRTYSTQTIAAGLLPADDPNRHVVWGAANTRVQLFFYNVDPQSPYDLELTFLSDTADRTITVTTHHNRLLEADIALPCGQPLTRRWTLPPESYQSGRIFVDVRPVSGADVPVCSMRLFGPAPASRPPEPLPPAGGMKLFAPAPQTPAISPQPPTSTVCVQAGCLTPRADFVRGVKEICLSLDGSWRFSPFVQGEWWAEAAANASQWSPIQVPGQWSMQGFSVPPGKTAGYQRDFEVPADWAGQRVKLRFDAVYAEAQVWVNGHEAGSHTGGMTPFELDITPLVQPGAANHLAVGVRSGGTKSDSLVVGNLYAAVDLGGITRKVTLFARPQVNIAALDVTTPFDETFTDAQLVLDVEIANESPQPQGAATLELTLKDPSGHRVALSPQQVELGTLAQGESLKKTITLPVASPQKWDDEHPNLYQLTCELSANGQVVQSATRRVGFRQVQVRGKQFLINGTPVKLHGASRHEAYPTGGRTLPPGTWRRDVELWRECNMNYLRTSHYPPPEELLDACDELGVLVECEGPMCFAGGTPLEPDEVPLYITQPLLEMVKFHRNHPSVIIWSIANESDRWRDYFKQGAQAIAQADPTRPRNLSGSPNVGTDDGELEIASPHYPGLAGPVTYGQEPRPVLFDECMHLNCYNQRELVTDPGVRDVWGRGVAQMWESVYASTQIMGTTIWSGVDEMFYTPDGKTYGFGPWGPIDGWRRRKPEFWHVKKIFSPLHIEQKPLPLPRAGEDLRITVQNRFNFSNLDEVRFVWAVGESVGTVTASAAPHTTATLCIPAQTWEAAGGQELLLEARTSDGRLIDTWRLPIGPQPQTQPAAPAPPEQIQLDVTDEAITIRTKQYTWEIDPVSGMIRRATGPYGARLLTGGPALMLLPLEPPPASGNLAGQADYAPLTETCSGWQATRVNATRNTTHTVQAEIEGSYKEAAGSFTLLFDGNGAVTVQYDFTMQADLEPRQIGLVFSLPRSFEQLSWQRQAQWSVVPSDHIGRPQGSTPAFPKGINTEGLATPRTEPDWPWSQDANALGCNDFRSTKMNILQATLQGENGAALQVVSDGSQHTRAWVDGEQVHLLVADYSNEGSAGFFNEHVIPTRPLCTGDEIHGKARFELKIE